MKSRIRIKDKNSYRMLTLCIVVFCLLGLLTYLISSNILFKQIKNNGVFLAEMISSELNGDALEKIHSESDPEYKKVLNILLKYKNFDMVKYVYTMRISGDDVAFIVDGDTVSPAKCGEIYPVEYEMLEAFNGKVTANNRITSDKWGKFVSVYAPIRNANNTIVAIVGCDIDAKDISQLLFQLRLIVFILIIATSIVALAFHFVVSAKLKGIDQLTEVANYDKFLEFGKKLKKQETLEKFNAMLVNIKDFKYINQRLGLEKGDLVLKEFAMLLQAKVTRKGIVARTGNDNFIILVSKEKCSEFIEYLRHVEIILKDTEGEDVVTINVRCGIYEIKPKDESWYLRDRCSVALQDTKKPGASDFIWFTQEMLEEMENASTVLRAYRKGIQNREFTVYYQPKVDMRTGKLCGAEALVRWFRDGKLVPPDKFIPVLEKEGLVTELDFYVFDMVCQNIRKWLDDGVEMVRISSNFSKMHFADQGLSDMIIDTMKKHNVPSQYLDIEITENSGFSDIKTLIGFVDKMNSNGIYVSMDDFGTGYSSLSMLKDVPVDEVKLDKSFLRDMQSENASPDKLLENVIRMISDMDKIVICEGVETKNQTEFLCGANCYIAQGYYYDRPLPHPEFTDRLIQPDYKERGK